MSRRNTPERAIHSACVQYLRALPSRPLFWHTPNGGWRHKIEAANLKRMGVLPGVSDLILVRDGMTFGLELKAPGGRATDSQLEFKSRLEDAGGYCVVADGLDRAIACLKAWGF